MLPGWAGGPGPGTQPPGWSLQVLPPLWGSAEDTLQVLTPEPWNTSHCLLLQSCLFSPGTCPSALPLREGPTHLLSLGLSPLGLGGQRPAGHPSLVFLSTHLLAYLCVHTWGTEQKTGPFSGEKYVSVLWSFPPPLCRLFS